MHSQSERYPGLPNGIRNLPLTVATPRVAFLCTDASKRVLRAFTPTTGICPRIAYWLARPLTRSVIDGIAHTMGAGPVVGPVVIVLFVPGLRPCCMPFVLGGKIAAVDVAEDLRQCDQGPRTRVSEAGIPLRHQGSN